MTELENMLSQALGQARMTRVLCLDVVDSTNDRLRAMLPQAENGQVVMACGQTAGRGRMGRSFASPAGTGVYLSMLLRPACAPAEAATLTAWAAVAVRAAIGQACGATPQIKWVNDLLLGGKKICGILTEASLSAGRVDHLILGVGINVNTVQSDFPPELQSVAGSLLSQTGSPCPLPALTAALIQALDELAARFPADRDAYLQAYRAACATPGMAADLLHRDGSRETVFVEAVADDFSLRVRYPDGRRACIASGEVSVRPTAGSD